MLHLIAPKRRFKRAVDRNRARRRVRASLDQITPDWRHKFSGHLYIPAESLSLPSPVLKKEIEFLLRKARIVI